MSHIKQKEVDSSSIKSFGYDAKTGTLDVLFTSNKPYRYFNVPCNVVNELEDADSIGSYFHSNIRNNYRFAILSTINTPAPTAVSLSPTAKGSNIDMVQVHTDTVQVSAEKLRKLQKQAAQVFTTCSELLGD